MKPLNYDPADPDKMRLPKGTSCGDCVHIRRCSAIYGHTASDTYCDWSPSRFAPAAKPAPEPDLRTCLSCGAVVPLDAAGNIPAGGLPCGH